MASCIFGGMYLHKIGREIAIIVGMFLILVQQVGLYMLTDFKSPTMFLLWSFGAQMIGGFGSGINAVASMAMVVSGSKPSEREQNIGLIEMATGVGFLLGPIWGSAMYQIGGYSAPFGSVGKPLLIGLYVARDLTFTICVYSSVLRDFLSLLRGDPKASTRSETGQREC